MPQIDETTINRCEHEVISEASGLVFDVIRQNEKPQDVYAWLLANQGFIDGVTRMADVLRDALNGSDT